MLENSSQLEWTALWRQEAKALEPQGLKICYKAPQDKILGEGLYADPETQAAYNKHILPLCSTAPLNAWDKVYELGERIESCTMIRQGSRERFSVFLESLSRAVQLEVADTESLVYENVNPQCKQVLWPLKISYIVSFRSACDI